MTTSLGDACPESSGQFAVLGSDAQFAGRIFTVRVDTVAMPGGGSAKREVVDHLRAVAVVAIDDDGQVVLIEQFRHPLRRRLWEIPAGLLDIDGEMPLAAAQRELVEEVGLAAEKWLVLVDLAPSPGFSTEGIRVYLAAGLREVPAPEALDEEADLRQIRLPLADAVAAVLDGRIVNATAAAGLLAASQVLADGSVAELRPGDDPWTDSEALFNPEQPIGRAPALADSRGQSR